MLILSVDNLTTANLTHLESLPAPAVKVKVLDRHLAALMRDGEVRAYLVSRPLDNSVKFDDELVKTLSEKERKVLDLVGHGLKNRQIGQILAVSEKTVEKYVTQVLRKLRLTSRAQAVWLVASRTGERFLRLEKRAEECYLPRPFQPVKW